MCDSKLFLICSRFVPDTLSGTFHTPLFPPLHFGIFSCAVEIFLLCSQKNGWGLSDYLCFAVEGAYLCCEGVEVVKAAVVAV